LRAKYPSRRRSSRTKLEITEKNKALALENPLQKEIAQLREELKSLSEKTLGLEKQKSDQEETKKGLESQISLSKSQISTLESEYSQLVTDVERISEEENQVTEKHQNFKKLTGENQTKRTDALNRIASLKQEIDLIEKQADPNDTIEDLLATEKTLQERLNSTKEQAQSSSQQKTQLKTNHEELQKQIDAEEAAIELLKRETSELLEKVTSLTNQANQLRDQIGELKAQKAQREEDAKKLSEAFSTDKLQVDTLQAEVESLKAKLKEADEKTSSTSEANAILASSVESLNSDLKGKLTHLKQIEQEATKLNLRAQELKAEIAEVDQKLISGSSPEPKSHEIETLEKTLKEKLSDLDQFNLGKTSQSTTIQTLRGQIVDIDKQILEAKNLAATEITTLKDRLNRTKQELANTNEQVIAA